MESISGYYQIPEDQEPAGYTLVDSELIDFLTGDALIDPNDGLPLTGESQETIIASANALSIGLMNTSAIPVEVRNRTASEVEVGLLGISRSEVALGLLGLVNTYGFNRDIWGITPGGYSVYTYFTDPTEWTFQTKNGVEYGWFHRHLPGESALQVYALPPEVSFTYAEDDGTGRYPGGYTDGVILDFIESKRTFRYQPGRITGVTMGVKMSTGSSWAGESVSWGCRNSYGDGYYFRLDRGKDLYIVRENPGIPTIAIARENWNGDPITTEAGSTGWNLDLSKVTMFKIEFGWYGAIGATFLAYVPIGNDEARWVKLHSIRAENTYEVPSLRSPYLRLFIQATQSAGAQSPAFINLYGSSVYIDGGDEGTVTTGSLSTLSGVPISNSDRAILGIRSATSINDVTNQRTIFPTSLSLSSDTSAKIDLTIRTTGPAFGESYGFGHGTTISRPAPSSFAVTRVNATTLSGTIPTGLPFTPASSHGYLYSGYPVKVVGSGLNNVFATSLSATTIGLNRRVPATTSGVALAAFDGYAVASGVTIVSGDGVDIGGSRQYTGKLYFTRPNGNDGGSYWRLGLWIQATGVYSPQTSQVAWIATAYPATNYTISGAELGEVTFPLETYKHVGFSILESGGTATIQGRLRRVGAPNPPSVTITGSPFPIGIVAELYPGASLTDVVLSMAPMPSGYLVVSGDEFSVAYDKFAVVQGSGRTTAITTWLTSGVNQATIGGADYVANKFEAPASLPFTGVLVDTQGRRQLYPSSPTTSFFLSSGECRTVPLSAYFGPDKIYLTGGANTPYSTGALFVNASTRATNASGTIFATLNWTEQ